MGSAVQEKVLKSYGNKWLCSGGRGGGGSREASEELAEASKPDGDRGDHLVFFLEPDL